MESTVSHTHATPTANNYKTFFLAHNCRTLFLIEGFYPYPFTDLYLNNSCCIAVTIPIAAVSTSAHPLHHKVWGSNNVPLFTNLGGCYQPTRIKIAPQFQHAVAIPRPPTT